jgi:hypothetical protein
MRHTTRGAYATSPERAVQGSRRAAGGQAGREEQGWGTVPEPGPVQAQTGMASTLARTSSACTRADPACERPPRRPQAAGEAGRRRPRWAEQAGGAGRAEKLQAEARARMPGPRSACAPCAMTNVDGAHANTHRLRPPRQAGGRQVECQGHGASRVGACAGGGGQAVSSGRWAGGGRRAMSGSGVMGSNNAASARCGCQALELVRAWGTWPGEMHYTTTRWRPFHLVASTSATLRQGGNRSPRLAASSHPLGGSIQTWTCMLRQAYHKELFGGCRAFYREL